MNTAHDRDAAIGDDHLAIRFISDDLARRWSVMETRDSRDGGADGDTRVLVFATRGTMRRVRNVPANWRELTDKELYAVSLAADQDCRP